MTPTNHNTVDSIDHDHDVNVYLTWVLSAIYGLTAGADALKLRAPNSIRRISATLRARHPVTPAPVYRGVLLAQAAMLPDDRMTWLSWSEDREVARWFASPDSYISGPFRAYAPEARGYVLTLARPPSVLWHHSWRRCFGEPLERFALQHPQMGYEGSRQIGWSLDTQREVITEPLLTFPTPVAIDDCPGAPIDELDRRLTPSWIS